MGSLRNVKNLTFDLIGTCYDWHTPVTQCLQVMASRNGDLYSRGSSHWSSFAHEWRKDFFAHLGELARANRAIPINQVFKDTLSTLLKRHNIKEWDEDDQAELIASWSRMTAWQDTVEALRILRKEYTLMSLTNGSTRTTIDVAKREGVQLDAILCSDIVGAFKPNPTVYKAALGALQCQPDEIAMVAAHAYDLQAAAKQGFKTIYILRETEDLGLHPSELDQFDLVVREGGLGALARLLVPAH